jgi:class 3 adenylate cyclase
VILFIFVCLAVGFVSRLYVKLNNTEILLRQEHEKSEMILRNIFPKTIVERLKNGEVLIADKYLDTTILFSDLVGFTHLTKVMPPHDLINLLNKVITGFDQLSEKLGIEKIKTIGDAYLVVSGLPDVNSNHAPAIVQMALEMQKFIAEFNRAENTNLQIRIGIHSGAVIGGIIGPKKFTFDLWGDTVNFASRLESTGVPGKIQVSQATYELVKNAFQFEAGEPFEMKGHGLVQTYFLVIT